MEARKPYPVAASDYRVLEEIGHGRNATVHRALCVPRGEIVSIKSIDLEKCRSDLDEVRREAQTLSLIDHPNVVAALALFIVGQRLWVVMPYMAAGSCLTIMRVARPYGLDELLVATVLRECLKALDYLHFHGHIHRDVKAGNILVDQHGGVKLGDFGVSACLFDCYNRQIARRTTFAGTPCWMAPEVLDPVCGYDCSADIWSLGITALELAQGHAPLSDLPPMKMVLVELSSPPPTLEPERAKVFSKSFKDFVACCLQKEASKRPTAGKLLKHGFFKHAQSGEYLVEHLLRELPPLWEQVRELRNRDVAELGKKISLPEGEQQKQQEVVSEWNFCVADSSSSSSTSGKGEAKPEEEEKK
ncbi:MAP kinase [Selaginella moellendorffii]|uniref:MAP kinase n=1 Tax=Selaginella moellendorffii TaxID=88036 RepID=D8S3L0_SELML|nr:serine/threonine-protein kinase fray2 [Selaginella moellendorffii]EFJ21284.1 MAP kinase [Selaginella moellendorffii]|eukprot:XP_002977946.1 serine/threonine-protein kinase fray2 [Selaginella moellendorffii]